jgi:hypothetical protein
VPRLAEFLGLLLYIAPPLDNHCTPFVDYRILGIADALSDAFEMHAHKIHTYKVHSYEVHSYEVHSYEVHA